MTNDLRDEIQRQKMSGEQERMTKIMDILERLSNTADKMADVIVQQRLDHEALIEKVENLVKAMEEHCVLSDYCPHTMR